MKLGDLRKALRALAPERVSKPEPPSLREVLGGDEAPARCPKCHAVSPCIHFESVDVGVGVMTGDHQYSCPVHGDFAYGHDDGKPIFRDDGPIITISTTLTTPEEARKANDVADDIVKALRDGGGHIGATMKVPGVVWASLHAPDGSEIGPRTPVDLFKSGDMLPPDPTTGTRLELGKTTIVDLSGIAFPRPDEVTFAPVCGICGDVNCETPNAKH